MSDHAHHPAASSPSIWNLLNKLIGAFLVLFAGYWGLMFVVGGINTAIKIRAPKEDKPAATAAAPAPAAAPAAATPAAATEPAYITALTKVTTGPAQEITLKQSPANPLMFDTSLIKVKAGQLVRLTFDNTVGAPLQHNVLVGKAGSKDALMAAAMAIGMDPTGLGKSYLPDAPDALAAMKLVNPGQKGVLEFTPASPGDYPFMCTFIGHTMLMNGIIKAE